MSQSDPTPVEQLDNTGWEALSSAVARFESQWNTPLAADIAAYLPPVGDPLRQRILVELLKVDQEFRCQRGELRKTEQYLEDWPELQQAAAARRELLFAECLTRAIQGELPDREELGARFPDLVGELNLEQIGEECRHERELVRSRATEKSPRAEQETVPSGQIDETADDPYWDGDSIVNEQRTLGKYTLRKELGRGTAAIVYRALDTQLKREVAIKVPRPELVESEEFRERLLREAQAAASLRHSSIVPIHEVANDNGRAFIVFELVEGTTLAAKIRENPLSFDQTALWVLRMAEALDYAHRNNTVHRDVKPENILIDRDDRPLLSDFGLARQQEAGATLTRDGDLLGTPVYMAPEQARGEGHHADGRSDIYSLGAVLYELLTGQRPFEGTVAAVLSQVVHAEPERPRRIRADIPPDLETICLKAMAKKPARRYPTAGQMADDLRRYLNGFPTTTTVKTPAQKMRLWLVEQPLSAAIVIASMLVAIAAWTTRPQQPDVQADAISPTPPTAPTPIVNQTEQPGDTITNSIGMTLAWIPAGEFLMGGTRSADEIDGLFGEGDAGAAHDEHPRHSVSITQPFYMGTTEVTQQMWEKVMNTAPWLQFGEVGVGAEHPACHVSWEDAVSFCERLSELEGHDYRLPTEAEWEYSCRAGGKTMYSFGDLTSEVENHAWFQVNAWDVGKTWGHDVGTKPPNAWGLYDMHGNVNEFCSDWYDPEYYSTSPSVDPQGPPGGMGRVIRGGSFFGPRRQCRSAFRHYKPQASSSGNYGFRVVRVIKTAADSHGSELPESPPVTPNVAAQATTVADPPVAEPTAMPGQIGETMTNSVGMDLAWIPAGSFQMGSTKSAAEVRAFYEKPNEREYDYEHPRHTVTLTKPFLMATTEVTQAQWQTVMSSTPWLGKTVRHNPEAPVVMVTWDDAMEFCRQLGEMEQATYRLPTEAEWEYACRAGTATLFSCGDDELELKKYAWYSGTTSKRGEYYLHRVAMKLPNAWGLFDMHGNAYEWCFDWYSQDYYGRSAERDPLGPDEGLGHVFRGGNYQGGARFCRSAYRYWHDPKFFGSGRQVAINIGFRVVRILEAPPEDRSE